MNTCERLHMSCPEGMKPSVDYMTCIRHDEYDYMGLWMEPGWYDQPANLTWNHKVVCLERFFKSLLAR